MNLALYRRQFYDRVRQDVSAVIEAIERWALAQSDLRVGRGDNRTKERNLHIIYRQGDVRIARLKDTGAIEIDFEGLAHNPRFSSRRARAELAARLSRIPGCSIKDDDLDYYPSLNASLFLGELERVELLKTLSWLVRSLAPVDHQVPPPTTR